MTAVRATFAVVASLALVGCAVVPPTPPVFAPAPASRVGLDVLQQRYGTAASRYVEIDGVKVHYRDEGRGPTIVLLHGSFGSLRNFDRMAETLRHRYRVIRYDQPPAGLSGTVPAGFNGTMDEFLHRFLQRLEVGPAIFLGTSSGGIIAYRYAANHPEMVRALILSNVPPSAPVDNAGAARRAPEAMQRKLAACTKAGEPRDEACWRVFLEFNFVRPRDVTTALVREYTDFNRREDAQRFSSMTPLMRDDVQVRDLLSRVRAPTLLLWGEQDFVLPPATMQTMADRLTAAPVETRLLQGVSHYPPLEAPRAVTAAVLSFLERLRAAPATRP
jgi:pimeloyl-ACP methyl ester carboxylesterase